MQDDLFGGGNSPTKATPQERLEYEDLYSIYLCEHYSLPQGWRWFDLDSTSKSAPEGYVRVVGAVAPGRRGAKAWRQRDRTTERTMFFSLAEFSAWKADRERVTGVCQECSGNGSVIYSVGVEGTVYFACRHCNATGRAP